MKIELVDHRGQYRIDLDDISDNEKIELIKVLCENTVRWGKWRFTNKAIWINQDAKDLVMAVKLLADK